MEKASNNQTTQAGTSKTGESRGVSTDASEATVDTLSPIVSEGAIDRCLVRLERSEEAESQLESLMDDTTMSLSSSNMLSCNNRTGATLIPSRKPICEKRVRSPEGCQYNSDSLSDKSAAPLPKVPKTRGRQRYPTSAIRSIGLSKATKKLAAAKRGEQRKEVEECAESETVKLVEDYHLARASCLTDSSSIIETETGEMSHGVRNVILQLASIVSNVEVKSKNIKGTFRKSLKEVVAGLMDLGERVHRATASEETARLEREVASKDAELRRMKEKYERVEAMNARMFTELAELRKEMAALREESKRDDGERERRLMVQFGELVNARFEAVESRLLPETRMRPPLAADRARKEGTAKANPTQDRSQDKNKSKKTRGSSDAQSQRQDSVAVASASLSKNSKRKKKTVKRNTAVVQTPISTVEHHSVPTAENIREVSWTTVVKRGKTTQKNQQGNKRAQSLRQKAAMLHPPRSAAIVLTLLSEGVSRGLTYASIISEAKNRIDLASLGIESVRFKRAATGAAIIEILGVTGEEKADLLADKLKEVLNDMEVRITRPTKCAELRISGLDDSTTSEEVTAAIVKTAGCLPEMIKIGTIRRGRSGTGTVWHVFSFLSKEKGAVSDALKSDMFETIANLKWIVEHNVTVVVNWDIRQRIAWLRHTVLYVLQLANHRVTLLAAERVGLPKECDIVQLWLLNKHSGLMLRWYQNILHKMALRYLQANINHCAKAQDLLVQSMMQWLVHVAVIAEPYYIPNCNEWLADNDGLVAIVVKMVDDIPPLRSTIRGHGWVAVILGDTLIIGVYFSPNRPLSEFEDYLLELETVIRQNNYRQVLVAGDFNAKSVTWGSPATSARGAVLDEWIVAIGLVVMNQGSINTCVRQQGGSIVDITLASSLLASRVQDWRVLEDVETLSDHRYIRFDISTVQVTCQTQSSYSRDNPRWSLKRLDRDALRVAAIVQAWVSPPLDGSTVDVETETDWFQQALSQICDAAMPRVRSLPPKRQVYWWSGDLATLRSACVRARRLYSRLRRRRHRDEEMENQRYAEYREAKNKLKIAMEKAKVKAREEFLETLSRDPWGRPYRLALCKLRSRGPPLTKILETDFLDSVVGTLFPIRDEIVPPVMAPSLLEQDVSDVPVVSEAEFNLSLLRLRAKNTAPGLD
ncbi:uncharacterized protein LOC119833410, partial [Zerene cesonia]|uniref:uncharacterized protein LOC119833410 n=1 Tax=Zerene cesonia TaxID=33412 RepID=UPI0018E5A6EB